VKSTIQCPQCKGSGIIPMPLALTDTLQVLLRARKNFKEGISADEVHAICADSKYIKVTAVNNRLVKLERLGLVTREIRGKTYFWSAKGGRK